MNKFKDKSMEEDIFVETESSNTSIVNVESIVKSHNRNNFNNSKDEIDIERDILGKDNKER